MTMLRGGCCVSRRGVAGFEFFTVFLVACSLVPIQDFPAEDLALDPGHQPLASTPSHLLYKPLSHLVRSEFDVSIAPL